MKPAKIKPEYQDIIKTIGLKIRDLRKRKKISYVKMADEIGISRCGYNYVENGKTNFHFVTLLTILSYHEIDVSDFFGNIKP